jgi:hypothetical protein
MIVKLFVFGEVERNALSASDSLKITDDGALIFIKSRSVSLPRFVQVRIHILP